MFALALAPSLAAAAPLGVDDRLATQRIDAADASDGASRAHTSRAPTTGRRSSARAPSEVAILSRAPNDRSAPRFRRALAQRRSEFPGRSLSLPRPLL